MMSKDFTTNNYWNHKGTYQVLCEALNELIPNEGSVEKPWKNKELERFRKASNAYYDIFNNGGCNSARSINHFFGKEVMRKLRYRMNGNADWHSIFNIVDPIMDVIIMKAATEQDMV